ncbi:M20 family metallopeptidase [Desulfosarcina sp.]|uniref:M20 family metallopeptidase n=1 Tax=Desulfosarcina sp. TaxID=2027861 RepID=UPI0029B73D9B|nr:M20 family metallopeptidase [Desulfosarcina sp.]MDX2452184.1 M20 family metallopeptidase [Desulfosarcina sp.]MDX2489977.1 M20 family metallopeptidase [Desulfosarcina sp.]
MREIVDLTKDLIRFKSTHTRSEEIQKCARFIETWLKDHDIACTFMESNAVPSIRALPARHQTPVLLMAHIDVVNAADPLFEPIEKDGRLYGRGAIDDKYAAALSMVLLKNRIQSNHQRGLDDGILPLGVLITGDEEVGGYDGARSALSGINCDFCIALDGGRVDKIVVKEKGILRLKVVARGKTAHGARPWKGENAIERLMADCLVVKGFFEGLTAPEHWHRTMNLSVIHAGGSVNQVPDEAEAIFDIRYTEHDDVDDLVQQIQAAVTSQVIAQEPEPLFISPESTYLERLLALATDTRTGIAHGASDARFLSQFNIPGIVWGADGNSSQHSTEEHVEIQSLSRLYDLLDRFVNDIQENPI